MISSVLALLEGKKSVKGHRVVLSSKSFTKQNESHSRERMRAGCVETRSSPATGWGWVFQSGGKSLPVSCVI